jgi:hypothetical protein
MSISVAPVRATHPALSAAARRTSARIADEHAAFALRGRRT